jgi:chloramphenicol-sensitive protein RarD
MQGCPVTIRLARLAANWHKHRRIMSPAENRDTKEGFLFAGAAYFIWGFLPLYMKLLSHIPALEIVPHRILWSLPVSAVIVWAAGLMPKLWAAFKSPRTLALAALTASIVSFNWFVYVWAINAGQTLQAALGYYINPLFSVFLAGVLVGERLTRVQQMAIGLAAAAVALLTWEAGGLPFVVLALCISWGFYAYFKKTLPVGPTEGFCLEIILLSLPSALMWVWFEGQGRSSFGHTGWGDMLTLMGTGLLTAIPLTLYANGAKRLTLTTIALMQYTAPTMIFLIAVFVFKEPFSSTKLAAFGLIWTALAIYSWTLFRRSPT